DDMQLFITGDSRTSKTKKRKLEHSKINTYLAKPLSKVNKKQSSEAYAYLNPNLHLPDCCTFARKTLNTVSDDIALYVINQAKTSEYRVTVAFDGWTNVVNQCLIESVLVTNNGEPLIWDIVDVSGHRERTEEIMEYTEKIFNDIKKEQIVVIALVTDSAAAYAASWY
ncbi:2101_t:CDS:2, partial [Gigaspora rosea]